MLTCATCVWRVLDKSRLYQHCEGCLVERETLAALAAIDRKNAATVAPPSREFIAPELVCEIDEIVRESCP